MGGNGPDGDVRVFGPPDGGGDVDQTGAVGPLGGPGGSGGNGLPPPGRPVPEPGRGGRPDRDEDHDGREVDPTSALPPVEEASIPAAVSPEAFLHKVLKPQMLLTFQSLLVHPDPKIRKGAADSVAEMVGLKGKVAPNMGGIHFNIAPDKARNLIGGLTKVLTGRKAEGVIDV